MNDELRTLLTVDSNARATYRQARQAIAELEMISHAPTATYQLAPPEDEARTPPRWRLSDRRAPVPHLGSHGVFGGDSVIPRGGDVDRPGRDADADERMSWFSSYQRKTPTYFRHQLAACETAEQLTAVRDDCRAVLDAWRKTPQMSGIEPARGSFLWKCQIADDDRHVDVVREFYSVGKRTVYRYRERYRGVRKSYVRRAA